MRMRLSLGAKIGLYFFLALMVFVTLFPLLYVVSGSFKTNMEIMLGGHGKGTAVKWLCGHLGVDPEEAMAFGDNTNDQTMLDAVGWSCAVENAVESLKNSAKIITPACEADGVAQTIESALRGEIG